MSFAIFMEVLVLPQPQRIRSEKKGPGAVRDAGLCAVPLCSLNQRHLALSEWAPLFTTVFDLPVLSYGPESSRWNSQGAAGADEFSHGSTGGDGQRPLLSSTMAGHPTCCKRSSTFEYSRTNCGIARSARRSTCASEANAVIAKFTALTTWQKQDILNFLRSFKLNS